MLGILLVLLVILIHSCININTIPHRNVFQLRKAAGFLEHGNPSNHKMSDIGMSSQADVRLLHVQ
jgi:hypothetical protein